MNLSFNDWMASLPWHKHPKDFGEMEAWMERAYNAALAQQTQPEPSKAELVCWCADGPLGFCPQHST